MKKRTKKKLAKVAKKSSWRVLKGIGKVFYFFGYGFYHLCKYSWNCTKFVYKKIRGATSKDPEIVKDRETKKTVKKYKSRSSAKHQKFNELKVKKGHLHKFEDFLFTNKSTIGIILGARGTGKSAIGMFLLENFGAKSDKNLYALGFKQSSLPKWIQVVKDISEIENNSVLLVDEGGIEFSSRDAMSNANKLLSEILLISRHRNLSVIFITQNSANLELNAIRQADYLILKPSSLLQKDFERKKIKQVYESVEDEFDELKEELGLTYLYSDKYCGFVANNLPSFWSERVSKGYAGK